MAKPTDKLVVSSDSSDATCVAELQNTKAPKTAVEIHNILELIAGIIGGVESKNPVIKSIRGIFNELRNILENKSDPAFIEKQGVLLDNLAKDWENKAAQDALEAFHNASEMDLNLNPAEIGECERLFKALLEILNTQVETAEAVNALIPDLNDTAKTEKSPHSEAERRLLLSLLNRVEAMMDEYEDDESKKPEYEALETLYRGDLGSLIKYFNNPATDSAKDNHLMLLRLYEIKFSQIINPKSTAGEINN